MSVEITSSNFESMVLKSEKPVIVDFWATWCGPCRMMGPVVEKLADELGDRAVVGKINVDEQADLAARYNVMTIPTVMLFKNGQPAASNVGFVPLAKLKAALGI